MNFDKQTDELVGHLDNIEGTLSRMLNASANMKKVAADCDVGKGDAPVDRLKRCETALKDWQKELTALEGELATLKQLYSAFEDKQQGGIASAVKGVWSSASAKAAEMRAQSDSCAKALENRMASRRNIQE